MGQVTPGGNPVCEDCGKWYGIGAKHIHDKWCIAKLAPKKEEESSS